MTKELSKSHKAQIAETLTKDLIGQRFGRLLVLQKADVKNHHTRWLCLCDCGNQTTPKGIHLRNGMTTSCGCFRSELRRQRKSYPEAPPGEKWCQRCQQFKALTLFHKHQRTIDGISNTCKQCQRNSNLRTNFGITLAEHDALLEQQANACAICLVPFSSSPCVDHDHTQPKGQCVRGLLCQSCNKGLGVFLDDPVRLRQAADYLERYRCGGVRG
ncbi:MAG: hypothetical protein KGL39_28270 [Patescibacteria group bacterium]|nr:hypothetical protein [Patescibacteria group bacterium]